MKIFASCESHCRQTSRILGFPSFWRRNASPKTISHCSQMLKTQKVVAMAALETSKIAATKAPAASDAAQATPPAKKNSVVAPTYAYKIIATLGHLCVTAFVLASFAGWFYLLNPRAKVGTFLVFVYGHYRYARISARIKSRGASRLTGCFVAGAHAACELAP